MVENFLNTLLTVGFAICISYTYRQVILFMNQNHGFTHLVEYRLLKRNHHKLQAQHPTAQNEAILLALS